MPEADAPTVLILLWLAVALLVCLLVCLLALGLVTFRRLSRIERRLVENSGRQEAAEAAAATEIHAGGAFEAFLTEDPSRRELPKREQFAAYRQWRHERGLNWSNS